MDLAILAAYVAAYVASIAVPLVLLPWALDRRGDLPYNSVASRLLAWFTFAALMTTVSSLGPARTPMWESGALLGLLGLVGLAAALDLWDLIRRRIPQGRHPDP